MSGNANSLTVVTLNTWKGAGAYAERLRLIGDQLAALAPDLVLLQEVFAAADHAVHTGATLAEALAMDHAHEPARACVRPFRGDHVDSTSGLSILSRTPIGLTQRLTLPSDPEDGERIALIAQVACFGVPMSVVNVHLTYLKDAHALRRRQLEAVLAVVPADGPVLIGGDFNAEPESEPLAMLRGLSDYAVADAWHSASGAKPTMTRPGTQTIAGRCVDHIILLQPRRQERLRLGGARRVLDIPDPATGLLPSDHAGLLATLTPAP